MDPHQVLGVAPEAPLADAEDAYRRLLLIHHPDLHQDGSAAERAAAEQLTRRLNSAIAQVRAGASVTAGVGARPAGTGAGPWWASSADDEAERARAARPRPGPDAAPGSPAGGRRSWDHAGNPEPADAGSTAGCPMCGAPLRTRTDLLTHVAAVHDLHLDHRLRPTKARRRRRPLRGLRYHSPWALLPVNALAALVLATGAGQLTHDTLFARWTFAVAMAPTIIRTLTQGRPG